MMEWYTILQVLLVTIPLGYFKPTPLDDLTINFNLDKSPKDVGFEEDVMDVKENGTIASEAAWLRNNQGVRPELDTQRKRIIGDDADVDDWKTWPWAASLSVYGTNRMVFAGGRGFCGGVLVSREHIVTAQHCLYDMLPNERIDRDKGVVPPEDVSISLGSTEYMGGTATFKGKAIFYKNTGFPTLRHDIPEDDIAVIQMTGKIDLRSGIRPILLPTKNVQTKDYMDEDRSDEFFLIGWGLTPKKNTKLRQTNQLKIVPVNNCRFGQHFICTRSFPKTSPKAAWCLGDSGGPGMIKYKTDGKWHLQGIMSYSRSDCTKDGESGLANVFHYINDLAEIVAGKQPQGWIKVSSSSCCCTIC